MNLFRTLSGVALTVFFGAGLSSCLQAPDYPVTPRIEENSVTVFRRGTPQNDLRDSIEVALNFEDGDGDLGLDDTDTSGVFAYNGGRNRFYENYFIQPYYKNEQGVFVPTQPLGFENGRFIRLTEPDSKPGPIRGVLRRAILVSLLNPAFSNQPGTEYQFEITIVDRALHESNKVITKPIRL